MARKRIRIRRGHKARIELQQAEDQAQTWTTETPRTIDRATRTTHYGGSIFAPDGTPLRDDYWVHGDQVSGFLDRALSEAIELGNTVGLIGLAVVVNSAQYRIVDYGDMGPMEEYSWDRVWGPNPEEAPIFKTGQAAIQWDHFCMDADHVGAFLARFEEEASAHYLGSADAPIGQRWNLHINCMPVRAAARRHDHYSGQLLFYWNIGYGVRPPVRPMRAVQTGVFSPFLGDELWGNYVVDPQEYALFMADMGRLSHNAGAPDQTTMIVNGIGHVWGLNATRGSHEWRTCDISHVDERGVGVPPGPYVTADGVTHGVDITPDLVAQEDYVADQIANADQPDLVFAAPGGETRPSGPVGMGITLSDMEQIYSQISELQSKVARLMVSENQRRRKEAILKTRILVAGVAVASLSAILFTIALFFTGA